MPKENKQIFLNTFVLLINVLFLTSTTNDNPLTIIIFLSIFFFIYVILSMIFEKVNIKIKDIYKSPLLILLISIYIFISSFISLYLFTLLLKTYFLLNSSIIIFTVTFILYCFYFQTIRKTIVTNLYLVLGILLMLAFILIVFNFTSPFLHQTFSLSNMPLSYLPYIIYVTIFLDLFIYNKYSLGAFDKKSTKTNILILFLTIVFVFVIKLLNNLSIPYPLSEKLFFPMYKYQMLKYPPRPSYKIYYLSLIFIAVSYKIISFAGTCRVLFKCKNNSSFNAIYFTLLGLVNILFYNFFKDHLNNIIILNYMISFLAVLLILMLLITYVIKSIKIKVKRKEI